MKLGAPVVRLVARDGAWMFAIVCGACLQLSSRRLDGGKICFLSVLSFQPCMWPSYRMLSSQKWLKSILSLGLLHSESELSGRFYCSFV